MIEISLDCALRSCPQPFLAQQDGDEWLFWCQYCARVFVVDGKTAAGTFEEGGNPSCTRVNPSATCV